MSSIRVDRSKLSGKPHEFYGGGIETVVNVPITRFDVNIWYTLGVFFSEAIRGELIMEKCRSFGAQLVNVNGDQFIHPLEPRNIVSSAIIKECAEGREVVTPTGAVGLWLDMPMIDMLRGTGTIKRALPAMYRQFIRHGIDITQEPVLTYPTLHYQNGGIEIDTYTRVLKPGGEPILRFLAAGEVSGGVHGWNRLMGNSLADILVFGRRAGIVATKIVKETTTKQKLSLGHIVKYVEELKAINVPRERKSPLILPDNRGERVLLRSLGLL